MPSILLEKEQYAARTIRPRIWKLVPSFLVPLPVPKAYVVWQPSRAMRVRAKVEGALRWSGCMVLRVKRFIRDCHVFDIPPVLRKS